MKTLDGDRYIEVKYPEFSLIPEKKAIAEVTEACEILYHLREVEPREKREGFAYSIFDRLRDKYRDSWGGVWEAYCHSPHAGQLIAKMDIDTILNEEGG